MFKMFNMMGFCLALPLFFGGFSDARADFIIDAFLEDQSAPPDDFLANAPSAIGGSRFLEADGDIVAEISMGIWATIEDLPPAGSAQVTYDANGQGLGVDLTEGGVNTRFEIPMIVGGRLGDTLNLFITDSIGVTSSYSILYAEIPFVDNSTVNGAGTFLIPFALLNGTADLTSVDIIRVRNELFSIDPGFRDYSITEIRVSGFQIPEPTSGLLLCGCGLLISSRRSRI